MRSQIEREIIELMKLAGQQDVAGDAGEEEGEEDERNKGSVVLFHHVQNRR